MGNEEHRKLIIDGALRGEKKNVKKGGNWIVRLNLFASSC
jgi:hypothetical protein